MSRRGLFSLKAKKKSKPRKLLTEKASDRLEALILDTYNVFGTIVAHFKKEAEV